MKVTQKGWMSIVASAAIVGMVGCGGGGGGTAPESTADATATLSGVAVDDLIVNGNVKATDAEGNLLATGKTDENGSYTLKVAHSGVVIVNVSCDENSTMYNPQTGTHTACPSDTALHALASVEESKEAEVHISPLSEIAYERAVTVAGDTKAITEDVVEKVRTEVGLMFGVDPVTDNPVKDEEAQKVIAAIHEVAESKDVPVMNVVEQLTEELKDGKADGENDETLYELTKKMDNLGVVNNLVDSEGDYTPPADAAPLSDKETVQKFITEVRTQLHTADTFIENEATQLDDALNNSVINIDMLPLVFNNIAETIGYMEENNLTEAAKEVSPTRLLTVTKKESGSWSYKIEEGETYTWEGTVELPEKFIGDNAEAELFKNGTDTLKINGTFPLDKTLLEGVEDNAQHFNGTVTFARTVTDTNVDATVEVLGFIKSNNDEYKLATKANIFYTRMTNDEGESEVVPKYMTLEGIALQGKIGVFNIDGVLKVDNYIQNSSLAGDYAFTETYHSGASGELMCASSNDIAVNSLSITYNGKTYTPVDTHNNGNGRYYFRFDGIEGELNGFNGVTVNLDAECGDGTTPQLDENELQTWSYSDEDVTNGGWLPEAVTFEGKIDKENGSELSGTLTVNWLNAKSMDLRDESQDKPLVKIAFDGHLQMPDRPNLLTTFTVENNATHVVSTLNYTYDATKINAESAYTANGEEGTIHIDCLNGIKAEITETNGTYEGKVTKDGKLVGTVEERNDAPVIKYLDGEFESLF